MKPTILLALFVVLTPSGTAVGQTLKPRPGVAASKPFTAPQVEECTYPNGMRLALVPFRATPTARIELVIRAGTADESPDQPAVASILAQLLLEGTRSRSRESIARLVSDLGAVGGSIGISTSSHETTLGVDVLPDGAPAMVELLADLIRHPSFPAAALERAKSNTMRSIQVQRTQADWLVSSRTNSLLFPANSLDRIPAESEIQSITLASIASFHADFYAPSRTRLYVAGTFDRAAVERAATRAYGDWATPSARPFVLPQSSLGTGIVATERPLIHLIDRPGATQARLQVSFPVVDQPHRDHFVLNEINMVMGSMQTARIVANIRERHGYSYNIFTRLVRRPGSTQWIVAGDITNNVVGAALREILGEIARLRTEAPAREELRGFQSFMSGIFISENSTARGVIESLRWMDLYGVKTFFGTFIQDVFRVSPDDIRQIAARYLTPARMAVVIVGDRNALASQLEQIGRVVD
jgi:zinc protease